MKPESWRMASPAAADLFGDIMASPPRNWRAVRTGLVVVAAALLAAAFLSERYGMPLSLGGLLVGLSLNFLSVDRRLDPGLSFASTELLRLGIVLLGARITLAQIAGLGLPALCAVVIIVAATMASTVLIARWMGLDRVWGLLAGGAVAICGASAAMALASVLGGTRAKAQLPVVLVSIAAMSAGAMAFYPIIAHYLHLADTQAGFFLGASIHDVAQALGAGYSYSDAAGRIATIVKLARVTLLAPVLAVVGMIAGARDTDDEGGQVSRPKRPRVPGFVLGFLAVAMIHSTGVVPARVADFLADAGALLIAASITASGIRSPLAQVVGHGVKPLLLVAGASFVSACLSIAVALWIL